MPTIDLGESGGARDGSRAHPPPHLPPHFPPRMRRGPMGAALVLVALLTLSAAQPPRPSWIEPLWTAELSSGARFTIGPHNVYLTLAGGGIVARDGHTGDVRWRYAVSRLALDAFDLGGGVAGIYRFVGPGEGGGLALSFVDDATGAKLAEPAGVLVGLTASGRVLIAAEPAPGSCPDVRVCADVSSYNPRTGGVAWRGVLAGRVVDAPRNTTTVGRFAMVAGRSVTLHDAGTGQAIGRVELPALPAAVVSYLVLVGEVLVEVTRDQRPYELTAYGFAPPRRLWSMSLPDRPPDTVGSASGRLFLSDCGQVQCVHLGGHTVLLDVATGRQRATIDAEVVGRLGAGSLLAVAGKPSALGAGLHVLDPLTGRPLRAFTDSELVVWVDSDGRALVRRQGPAGNTLTLLDASGNARLLGAGPAAPGSRCQARGEVMACATPDGKLTGWRLLL